MELKLNMYVRTPYGIRKILKIKKDDGYGIPRVKVIEFDRILDTIYKYDYDFYTDENVIKKSKASHNIKELIQENDYVNGNKVININGTLYVKNEGALEDIVIKSIVTKEQFESMKYEVE